MLYLPIGPPGAGKTHLANLMVETGMLDPLAVVSPDFYREVLTGNKSCQHENGCVFAIVRKITTGRLRNDLDVWVDATNLRADQLEENVTLASLYGANITTIWFDTPNLECVRRNRERLNPVPDEVMSAMFSRYIQIDQGSLPGTVVTASEVFDSIQRRTHAK